MGHRRALRALRACYTASPPTTHHSPLTTHHSPPTTHRLQPPLHTVAGGLRAHEHTGGAAPLRAAA
eukprot:scaffold64780_cov56-Phaeocystis_antarctica.AAC.2